MLPFLSTLQTDLELVDSRIEREFKLKSGSIPDLVPLELGNPDYHLRPFLLLAAARSYGVAGEKGILVASVLQFIYLATKVHSIVQDDQEKSFSENFQFPVLVGDYLYGQFFLYLCKASALEYLAPLAKVICEIHEGGILRKQGVSQAEELDIIAMEDASLYSAACGIGAGLGGAVPAEQELFRQFGRDLGLGIAALNRRLDPEQVNKAFGKARESLALLPVAVPAFEDVLGYFRSKTL